MLENGSAIIQIAVIASFNPYGKIKPLYFQYEDNKYQITSVISSRTEVNKILFDCTYVDTLSETIEGRVTLIYRIRDQIWGFIY